MHARWNHVFGFATKLFTQNRRWRRKLSNMNTISPRCRLRGKIMFRFRCETVCVTKQINKIIPSFVVNHSFKPLCKTNCSCDDLIFRFRPNPRHRLNTINQLRNMLLFLVSLFNVVRRPPLEEITQQAWIACSASDAAKHFDLQAHDDYATHALQSITGRPRAARQIRKK